MDVAVPVAVYCASPAQEVFLQVSGASREFPTFLKDAAENGGDWEILSDDHGATVRSIVMRAPPSITHWAVSTALIGAKVRKMETKVTFGAKSCSYDGKS